MVYIEGKLRNERYTDKEGIGTTAANAWLLPNTRENVVKIGELFGSNHSSI